jgi:hypothetical protein
MEKQEIHHFLEKIKTNLVSIPVFDDPHQEAKLMALMRSFNNFVDSLGPEFLAYRIPDCPAGPLERRK